MLARAFTPLLVLATIGCGGAPSPSEVDASPPGPDAPAPPPDADLSVPRPGFGDLSGMCGVLDPVRLTESTPSLVEGHLDFGTDRYDDPAERPQLTPGGATIVASPNEGGSSIFSETFAYEVLARCELATLLKLETQIAYIGPGSKTDLLVEIDGLKVGVSVTRAMTFPLGQPYTEQAATTLVEDKLAGILSSSGHVDPADAWVKQILAVLAYDDQHAEVFADAWAAADAELRADTILVVFVTDGDDTFIYTDS
ncbi:MAG: hypothetical protein R2939_20700 [Kofleriaceae bacterium]